MKGHKKEEEEVDHEAWLGSYTGFVTLLFAFFTVMYAMGYVNSNKIKAAAMSMSSAFKVIELGPVFSVGDPVFHTARSIGRDLEGSEVTVNQDERGLVLSLAASIAFEPGKADLLPEAIPKLNKVAGIISKLPHPVRVEGHTDNLPIHSEQFPSNWELSVARATAVVRVFENYGIDPKRLSSAGYGEYHPIASNETEVGRAQNRRVEIVLLEIGAGG